MSVREMVVCDVCGRERPAPDGALSEWTEGARLLDRKKMTTSRLDFCSNRCRVAFNRRESRRSKEK